DAREQAQRRGRTGRVRAFDRTAARGLAGHRALGHHAMTPSAPPMDHRLLSYYEAIERASADMLAAAKAGDWDQVVKLEGACVLLISQLKHAARDARLGTDEARAKSRIMQRI